ncbi:MAG: hypothetical protein HY754_07460 [Nitrospirae bacterium]|nr:hypothetical protein [Nitrospirota bacterium]
MKSIVSFIIFVLVVVGLLYSVSGRRYPRIPDNDLHSGITDTVPCMECHGSGKQYEMKKTHPPKYECFKCHKRRIKR